MQPIRTIARRVIVFGRHPVPGQVKTRLIQALGPLAAAEWQRQSTERTLSAILRVANASVDFVYTGARKYQVRRWLQDRRIRLRAQVHGDLGRRMQQAIEAAFDEGAGQVVLVGTDVPGLTGRHVAEAFTALATHDLVLGPSHDGGYWLIACRRPVPVFQGIDWGGPHVLSQTRAAAERNGLTIALLAPMGDIDTEADLRRGQPREQWPTPYMSIVIPTLNEADHIVRAISALRGPDIEIIVADGGSHDGTPVMAQQAGAVVVSSARGRARQQNAGARRARARVLLFLHADTRLPGDFGKQVFDVLLDGSVALGAFRFKTDWDHWAMHWVERGVHLRATLLRLPYGDQAFFMRRTLFERLGGFPEVPIAEDLLFARMVRREGRIVLATGAAVTSGRRWRALGIWRTTILNYVIAAGCVLGIDPRRLATLYRIGVTPAPVRRTHRGHLDENP